ncbi:MULTISPECIES: C4-type zinc ribbon domain-containing protein [unclassified Treponema]|jgi:predicted  nucleic acid-binding Zn-ribbon protein|uniref:zinc ribbon domain-containing protein n=1 Tax=unclassified Treponema TaxID=2638727 RepID=UPI001B2BEFF6|nr:MULTISPECIES: C4-type zinc ribbon domain-containing protein [unclassified Treponema]MBO6218859.1 nucleic acid-binding protein [Treponema sp.]MBQ8680618.1 nucleic acid-binding protein [Treponema sp.]
MEMTEVFDKLKSLQDVLVEKYDLEKKIESSPKQLDSQDELLARLKKEYIEKNKSYEEVKAEVEKLKQELSAAEASRESGEKDMDNITSHREYEALDKQISEATEKEASVRKDLQREEKKLAELDESLKADEAMISSQENDLNESKAALSDQIQSYKNQLESLKKQEDEIIPGLNQEIVYKFQRIIQRNSEGIVAVRNGVCTGCQMILPGQFANEVRDGEKILFCPYCSRILFYQEVNEEEAEDYSTLEETGSLADFEDEFADERDEDEVEDGENENNLDDEKSMAFDE